MRMLCTLGVLAVLLFGQGCAREVVIRQLQIQPSYACTGETISFVWDIKNVD